MSVLDSFKGYTRRTMFFLDKHSPTIFLGLGIGAGIGSTVLACKATMRVWEIKAAYSERALAIEEGKAIFAENPTDPKLRYDDIDAQRDGIISKFILCQDYIKLYGPCIALGIFGICCILKSHGIMKSRNAAISSAYTLISAGFAKYRSRVKSELGEEMDHHFRYGTALEESIEVIVGDDGKKEKKKVLNHIVDKKNVDGTVYSRIFDQKNLNWTNHDDYNWMFLRSKQEYYNFILMRDGVLFLNDIYEGLGFPKTKAGQVVGWSTSGTGDGVIDFGLKKLNISGSEINSEAARAYLLEFNVDGVVYDKLQLEA